jgi:peptide deformylase
VVISASDDSDVEPEGCLSLPGLVLPIRRSVKIKVMFRDAQGHQQIIDLSDGWSRIFLHEFDHLQGILIDDRVSKLRLHMALRKAVKRLKKQGVSA